MKLQLRLLSVLTMLSLVIFTSCKKDDGNETPPQQVALGELSKTWNIVSANDGTDRTSDFTGFKLTMSGTFSSSTPEGPYTYAVEGGQPVLSPWPQAPDGSGGTWTFSGEPTADSGLIARNDGVGMTYTISDAGQLTLTFNYSGDGYLAAKTASVDGNWTFIFN